MKNIILFVALLLLGSQDLLLSQEVIYGTVRSDGFQNITKGAFWSIRPEAKQVYEGLHPSGVEILILPSDYFIRFVDGEHNNNDGNYIILPKGEKIYRVIATGEWYAACCGNRIEYYHPVATTKIREPYLQTQRDVGRPIQPSMEDELFSRKSQQNPSYANGLKPFAPARIIPNLSLDLSSEKPYSVPLPFREKRKLSNFGKVAIVFAAAAASGILVDLILRNQPKKSSSEDEGNHVTPGGDGGHVIQPGHGP